MISTTSKDLAPRSVSDVFAAQVNGPTAQVDHNILVLPFSETQWDPFIVLSDDRFSTVGFDWHPHRGFQTVTLVLAGELEHRDNAGGFGVLGPGDAQYMAAGRYAMHYELAHQRRPVHTLQLWLNLPRELKLMDTNYVDLRAADAALVTGPGVQARVHAGQVGDVVGRPAEHFAKRFTLIDAELDRDGELAAEVPQADAALVYVVDGEVETGGATAATGEAAWFAPGAGGPGPIGIRASRNAHVVVYASEPIGEPVVLGGPFVMSADEEIEEAFADLHAGAFGPVPE